MKSTVCVLPRVAHGIGNAMNQEQYLRLLKKYFPFLSWTGLNGKDEQHHCRRSTQFTSSSTINNSLIYSFTRSAICRYSLPRSTGDRDQDASVALWVVRVGRSNHQRASLGSELFHWSGPFRSSMNVLGLAVGFLDWSIINSSRHSTSRRVDAEKGQKRNKRFRERG